MTATWVRNHAFAGTIAGRSAMLLAAVPAGKLIKRVIFGFAALIPAPVWAFDLLVGQEVFYGVETCLSGNTGALIYPDAAGPPEISYPQQRWLWWGATTIRATRQPDNTAPSGLVTMVASNGADFEQSHGQALSNTVGQTLGVYVLIAAPAVDTAGLELAFQPWGAVLYE